MSFLFDASALLNTVRTVGRNALDVVGGNYVLTSTPYEIGNALWRESKLLNIISLDEAAALFTCFEIMHHA